MANSSQFPAVTVGVPNYNGAHSIAATIDSIKQLTYPSISILMCDDASTDGSVSLVQERHPDVQILRNDQNQGVSRTRNLLLDASPTDLVFLVDDDITLDPLCLEKLIAAKLASPGPAVVVTPRVLNEDGNQVLSDGARLHYLAATVHFNRYEGRSEAPSTGVVRVPCGSGGIMLVDRALAREIDGFDSDFRFGWADGEFFIRASYSGLECYTVRDALVFHRQKAWGTKRAYFQIRNRWYVILINYSWRTLLMIFPAALIYETLLLMLMIVKGSPGAYARAMADVVKNLPELYRKRGRQQARKVLADRDFLTAGAITVDPGLIRNPLVLAVKRAINGAFDSYWKFLVVLRLV